MHLGALRGVQTPYHCQPKLPKTDSLDCAPSQKRKQWLLKSWRILLRPGARNFRRSKHGQIGAFLGPKAPAPRANRQYQASKLKSVIPSGDTHLFAKSFVLGQPGVGRWIRALGTGVSPYNGLAILSTEVTTHNPNDLESHWLTKSHVM